MSSNNLIIKMSFNNKKCGKTLPQLFFFVNWIEYKFCSNVVKTDWGFLK